MNKTKKIVISIFIFFIYYIIPHLFNLINYDNFSRNLIILFLFLIDLIPLIFLVLVYRKDLKNEFKPFKNNFLDNMDKYIRYYLLALILMTASNMLIEFISGSNISNNEQAIRDIGKVLPIYTILSCSFFAPIAEELAYRKTIRNIFVNKKLSIIASGIIFGLAHVLGTYTGISDLLYIIPYGIFGSTFMYIYTDSDSIWNTIFIHFMHNSLLLIAYYIR